ncbi:hypothetical protein K438DRAFT_178000 [Mycena galopus ATCC 62051]|nr:hypothetical protein K438DRAFT_178000 [Mycena galopus ATCC 62051]
MAQNLPFSMNAKPSATAAFEMAELCAYIIDFLHDSPKDLKSCGLASRAFTFPSQAHLFREIDIPSFSANALRLNQTLHDAPHLRSLVRRVRGPLDSATLVYIHQMYLSRLNWLELYGSAVEIDLDAIPAARNLLDLPSLHTLIVTAAAFPNRAAFDLLFERCTPALRTLDLRQVTVGNPGHVRASPEPLLMHSRHRAQITELRLRLSPTVAPWFLDFSCPLDLSRLESVDLYISASPELAQVFQNAIPTIERLRVHTQDITNGLSLDLFTSLTTLRVLGVPADLATALSSLPQRHDRLRVLMIASRAFHSYDLQLAHNSDNALSRPVRQRAELARVDSTVAALDLPALVRLELSVLISKFRDRWSPRSPSDLDFALAANPSGVETTRRGLVSAFPKLNARGMLVVCDYRGL